jgi:hypothetical protein
MKKFFPVLGCCIFLIACAKDSAKPNLAIGTPNNNTVFYLPDTFNVDASLLDGTMDQYKVQFNLQTPCEAIDTTSDGINFGNYTYLFVSGFSYNQNVFSHTVHMPADFTPGAYNCIVSCIVQQYNEGIDTVTVYLKNLVDTLNPVLTLSEPSGPVTIDKGDTLRIRGLMVENRTGLIQGQLYRVKVMLEANFGGQNALTLANQFPPSDPDDSLKVNYTIPMSISSGSYTLKITLLDEFNNYTVYTYSVYVN